MATIENINVRGRDYNLCQDSINDVTLRMQGRKGIEGADPADEKYDPVVFKQFDGMNTLNAWLDGLTASDQRCGFYIALHAGCRLIVAVNQIAGTFGGGWTETVYNGALWNGQITSPQTGDSQKLERHYVQVNGVWQWTSWKRIDTDATVVNSMIAQYQYVNHGVYATVLDPHTQTTTPYLEFYHQNGEDEQLLFRINASQFLTDGMVHDAYIDSATNNLIIEFNTDSGQKDIEIDMSLVFDPSNYYSKDDTDTLLAGKVSTSDFNALATTVNGKASQSALDALATTVSGKANQSALDTLSATVNNKATVVNVYDYEGENRLLPYGNYLYCYQGRPVSQIRVRLGADFTEMYFATTYSAVDGKVHQIVKFSRDSETETGKMEYVTTYHRQDEGFNDALRIFGEAVATDEYAGLMSAADKLALSANATAIGTEETRARGVEGGLRTDLNAEITNRGNADAEVILRMQGRSANTSGYDPVQYVERGNATEVNEWLDSLHDESETPTLRRGIYILQAFGQRMIVCVNPIQEQFGGGWKQTIFNGFLYNGNIIAPQNNDSQTLERMYQNNAWTAWKNIGTNMTDVQSAVNAGVATANNYTDSVAAGKASLVDGKVPTSQLPAYVDEIQEGYYYDGAFYEDSAHQTIITPTTAKIYLDLSTNKQYRYGGTVYVEVSQSLALGRVTGTAYDGGSGAALETSLSNEVTRATAAEDALNTALAGKVDQSLHDTEIGDLGRDIQEETARAMEAEGALAATVEAMPVYVDVAEYIDGGTHQGEEMPRTGVWLFGEEVMSHWRLLNVSLDEWELWFCTSHGETIPEGDYYGFVEGQNGGWVYGGTAYHYEGINAPTYLTNAFGEYRAATTTKAGLMSASDKAKLDRITPGQGGAQVQADWNQTDDEEPDYIKNRPNMELYEQKTAVQTSSDLSITPELNTCYRFGLVTNLSVVLNSDMGDYVGAVTIYFTAGDTTPIAFTGTGTKKYQSGITFEASVDYEANCLWIGDRWIIAINKLVATLGG